jgi:hypothetical protein
MYQYNLAYRHQNGEVEGFQGIGFGEVAAERDAKDQIARKLQQIDQPFEEHRIITSMELLTQPERKQVMEDWKNSGRVRY